jgi:hypothetical protein
MKRFFSLHPYFELCAFAVTLSLAIYIFARNPLTYILIFLPSILISYIYLFADWAKGLPSHAL